MYVLHLHGPTSVVSLILMQVHVAVPSSDPDELLEGGEQRMRQLLAEM